MIRDLLKRHAAGHSHDRDKKRRRLSSAAKQSRVSQACKTCAASKLKCDEEKPCKRCRERNLQCDWQETPQGSSPEPAQLQMRTPDTQTNIDLSFDLTSPVGFPTMSTALESLPAAESLLAVSHESTIEPAAQTIESQPAMDYGSMKIHY